MNKIISVTSHRVDHLLRKNKCTRAQLARDLGLGRSTITQKMEGLTNWTLRDVKRMADIFEVSTDYLTGRDQR